MFNFGRIFLCFLVLWMSSSMLHAHPIHVSVVNLEYLADSNRIDYSIQLFTEDFEHIINHEYNTLLSFKNRSRLTTQEQDALVDYLNKHFLIEFEGGSIPRNFKGWQLEDEQVHLHFSTVAFKTTQSLFIHNTLLIDYFADQVNLLITHYRGKESGIEFNKSTTGQIISFE